MAEFLGKDELSHQWQDLYNMFRKSNKGKNYVSRYDREIDTLHDEFLFRSIVDAQNRRQSLSHGVVTEMSVMAYDRAISAARRSAQVEETGYSSGMIGQAILEMSVIPQEHLIGEGVIRVIGMGNIVIDGMSPDEIAAIMDALKDYDPTLHTEQGFVNIVLFTSFKDIFATESMMDEMLMINRRIAVNKVRKYLLNRGYQDAKLMPKYPLLRRLQDLWTLHF